MSKYRYYRTAGFEAFGSLSKIRQVRAYSLILHQECPPEHDGNAVDGETCWMPANKSPL
jgi:hypothetical protein